MIFQVYFIVLPTVTFCLANLLVPYPNPFSFLLFSIRALNPLSGQSRTPHHTSIVFHCASYCYLLPCLRFSILSS